MIRTPHEEEELLQLIADQESDDTPYQRPQAGVQGYGLMIDLVDENGQFVKPRVSKDGLGGEGCPLHGNQSIVRDPSGTLRCRPCKADYARAARRKAAGRRARG